MGNDKINFEKYKEWFNSYTNGFLNEEDESKKFAIELKILHTFDTVKAMESIIEEMNFNENDYNLAKLIALLHDVGRFNQIRVYGHFNDSKSIDHASESVRIIKENDLLEELDEYTQSIIYNAIENHNKICIDEKIKEEKTVLFSKLIRDADKLDIYKVMIRKLEMATDVQMKAVFDGLEASNRVSDDIYEDSIAKRRILSTNRKTVADFAVLFMSWCVNDIYFTKSLQLIHDGKLIEKCYDEITKRYGKSDRLVEIYEFIISEIKNQLSI